MRKHLQSFVKDTRAAAFVELGLTLPVLTVLLFGVVTGGMVFGKYMTIIQLSRNSASMMARGTNFAKENNKQLLLHQQPLDITLAGGEGVIYLTRVTLAPDGTRNAGRFVIAERHVIGNTAFHASRVGEPVAAIWPHPDKPQPNGEVKNRNEELSALANVSSSISNLPPGESMYIAEIYHTAEPIRFGRAFTDPLKLSHITYF